MQPGRSRFFGYTRDEILEQGLDTLFVQPDEVDLFTEENRV
jgi:PAS domain-containing protein